MTHCSNLGVQANDSLHNFLVNYTIQINFGAPQNLKSLKTGSHIMWTTMIVLWRVPKIDFNIIPYVKVDTYHYASENLYNFWWRNLLVWTPKFGQFDVEYEVDYVSVRLKPNLTFLVVDTKSLFELFFQCFLIFLHQKFGS